MPQLCNIGFQGHSSSSCRVVTIATLYPSTDFSRELHFTGDRFNVYEGLSFVICYLVMDNFHIISGCKEGFHHPPQCRMMMYRHLVGMVSSPTNNAPMGMV